MICAIICFGEREILKLKQKIYLTLLALFICVLAFAITTHRVERGFYYWKSSFNLKPEDYSTLRKLNVKTLYIKFFDVVWDSEQKRAIPVSSIRFPSRIPKNISIIPTVFITNETMVNIPRESVNQLADHIHEKITRLAANVGKNSIREIQLDCDWTTGTRDKYFALLMRFHQSLPMGMRLSATIRLHQVKYRSETGVPPVDRGILMFYNMESPSDPSVSNAILNLQVGKGYLANLSSYPLPLDIALPLYSWGAVFQGERFIGLINNLSREELLRHPDQFSHQGNFFAARKNTWIRGTNVYKNDRIRVDESNPAECAKAAHILARRIRNHSYRVVIFHYEPELLRRAVYEKVASIYSSAR